MTKLVEAINLYNPKSQFTINGDDYDSLDWHSKDIDKPTLVQLEALIPLVEAAKAQAEAEAAAKRQALLAKLSITEDEARLLLGGN